MLRVLLVLVVLAALAAWVALGVLRRSGRAPLSGQRTIAALEAPVDVLFDRYGVPHVYAASERDAARAIGYLHAADRIVEMELGRRFAKGRLAEVLKPELVDIDMRSRRLGFERAAQRNLEALSPRSRTWLDAYAEGVNARIGEGERPPLLLVLGIEPEPWTAVDTLCFASLMADELAFPLDQEFHRLEIYERIGERLAELAGWDGIDTGAQGSPFGEERPWSRALARPGDGGGPGGGSNNWAVASERTASRGPLLAGDPHLGLGMPARWYRVRVSCPEYDVQGFTLPGVPVVLIGQSPWRAWSVTTTGLDAEDNHVEDFDPTTGTVRRGDQRVAVERRVERVRRRGTDAVVFETFWTDIGPLLPADARSGLPWRSLAWTLHEPADPVALFLALASENDLERVFQASESYVAPAQNLVVAQLDGTIAQTVIGRRPIRSRGDGRLPVPAWDESWRWSGLAPAATNPRVVSPRDGVLATANADVRPQDYAEPFTADFAHPSRRDRILSELRSRSDWDVESFARLQLDRVSPYALELVAALGEGLGDGGSPNPADQALAAEGLALLSGWDGRVEGAGAPAYFQFAVRELVSAVAEHALSTDAGAPLVALPGTLRGAMRDNLPRLVGPDSAVLGAERDRVVASALARAWRAARSRLGPEPAEWRLEDLQRLTLAHMLGGAPLFGAGASRGPFGFGGHDTTINVAWSRWRGEDIEVGGAASLRFVADVANPNRSLAVVPGGQSGHPAGAHYDDQLSDWLEGRMVPMAFDRSVVESRTASRLALVPAR